MIKIPYGSSLIDVDIEGVGEGKEVVLAKEKDRRKKRGEGENVIRRAIQNPLNTKRLRDLVKEKKGGKIVIVVDDHTREAPTEQMLDGIIEEIKGNEKENITLLVACGSHPPPMEEDLKIILGKYYSSFKVNIKIHDCNSTNLVYLGKTSRGTPVILNESYVEADIKILTGDITLHYYAGFGGGRKSILPGISARSSIQKNHALLVDERARTANIENNPIHLDMCEAASFASPDFVINTISDPGGDLVDAFAGEMDSVFLNGISVAKDLFEYKTRDLFDVLIVSAGGFPGDRDLYQATKAIEHCYRAVTPGGEMILVAECRGGIGDHYFEEWMDEYRSYEDVERAVKENFVLGGHKAFYMRKAMKKVYLSIVSKLDANTLNRWGINAYNSVSEAVEEEMNKKIQIQRDEDDTEKLKIAIVKNGLGMLLLPKVPKKSSRSEVKEYS